jgi:hypothetical protein
MRCKQAKRLWREQRSMEEARELLAPAYWPFTGGFETCNLEDATAVLDGLAA